VNRIVAVLALCLASLAPQSAFAHAASTSYLSIQLPADDVPVDVRWDMSLQDIAWTVFIDADYDGNVTWQEIQDARPALATAVLGQISLKRGAPCALAVKDFALAVRNELNFPLGGDAGDVSAARSGQRRRLAVHERRRVAARAPQRGARRPAVHGRDERRGSGMERARAGVGLEQLRPLRRRGCVARAHRLRPHRIRVVAAAAVGHATRRRQVAGRGRVCGRWRAIW
jgi:hypothetical protein